MTRWSRWLLEVQVVVLAVAVLTVAGRRPSTWPPCRPWQASHCCAWRFGVVPGTHLPATSPAFRAALVAAGATGGPSVIPDCG